MTSTNDNDLLISELANGAAISLENAEELFREAEILYKHKSICRAYFLHQISLEECGKIELIGRYATAHLMDFPVNLKKMKSQISNHKAKNTANAYMLPRSEEEEKAINEQNWKEAISEFNKQKIDFHQQSNSRKNASLYADFVNEKFLSPKEQISEEMVIEISKMNSEYISLIAFKVQMLSKWVKDLSKTKEYLQYFIKLKKESKIENPDDPFKAMEDTMEKMLEELKENK